MAPVPTPLTIRSLPSEIVEDILLRLSPKELIRCLCVLKSWNALIRSEQFYKAHLKRSQETNHYRMLVMQEDDPESEAETTEFFSAAFYSRDRFSNARKIVQPLAHPERVTRFVGSCNGLLLLHNRDLAIWNPTIQKFKRIPFTPIELSAGTQTTHSMYGFGYAQSSSDYKIVRIVGFVNGERGSEVKLYRLKSNLWKRIQSFPFTRNSSYFYSRAVPLNGALHWLVTDNSHSQSVRVVALDLSKKTFNKFSTPFADVEDGIGLEVLGGSLCICLNNWETSNEVWKMNEYGVAESWVHFYTVKQEVVENAFEYCTPLVLSKTGERVLLHNDSDLTEGFLFWYDLEKNTGKVVTIPSLPLHFRAAICVANLGLLVDPVNFARQQQVLPVKKKYSSSEGEGSEQAKQGDLN